MEKRTKILIAGAAVAAVVLIGAGFSRLAKAFADLLTSIFFLSAEQQNSVKEIVRAFEQYGDGDQRKLAYMLATAWHESRLRPIREIRAQQGSEVWYIQNKYWSSGYYGRGYVQITWEDNYRKMGNEIGVDLVNNPDAALIPRNAARIMVIGMMKGMFTGRKLADYINTGGADYYNARRTVGAIIVAGKDTAALIQGYVAKMAERLNS